MHNRIFALGKLSLAYATRTHTTRELEHGGDAGCIVVGALVVRGGFMQGADDAGHRCQNQSNHRQHAEKDRKETFGVTQGDATDKQQNRKSGRSANRSLYNQRKHLGQRPLQLLPNLSAVVTSDDDHLSTTRSGAFPRRTGIVFRHHVLAHAPAQKL